MVFKILLSSCFLAASVLAGDLGGIQFKDAAGKDTKLDDFSGKVLLLVNVASKCGFTRQYEALEELYQEKKNDGFVVLAFPCNDFGGQEPGTIEEIQKFCKSKFGVSFPIMGKLSVKGKDQHELYKKLTGPDAAFPGDVKWNFGKILIGKDGKPVARFGSRTKPNSAELSEAIELALAK